MEKYRPTIGLEIHAELSTKTKMFCACKNDPDEPNPNVNICPVCMAHPGTLPVINKEAVKSVLKVGLAVGGVLADGSEFDRKNYFYPDIPKGYQISQYKHPLVSGGALAGVHITRIHLEEDTATSSHEGDHSLIDFNRAGVPLMELVTEPVIHSAEEVLHFGRELQLLLQYLGVSEANMEKGEMRLEANISVSKEEKLGTKVEVKNLNSFRAAERAINYEIKRQSLVLEKGEKVSQETRGWNEVTEETFSQRSKENSNDYRYFPDPDLPKLLLSEVADLSVESLLKELRETPAQKRARYLQDFKIKESDIEVYVANRKLGSLFEQASNLFIQKGGRDLQLLSNYIGSDVAGLGEKGLKLAPEALAEVIRMIEKAEISSRGAKDIIALLSEEGGEAREIALRKDLFQKNDTGELALVIKKILEENQAVVAEYKAGKVSVIQFLVGQAMKATKGSANPALLQTLLLDLLK